MHVVVPEYLVISTCLPEIKKAAILSKGNHTIASVTKCRITVGDDIKVADAIMRLTD